MCGDAESGVDMKVKINIKGVSNRENKIVHIKYRYPDVAMTLRDFLTETVKLTVREYNKGKASEEILKCLSDDERGNQATAGKVAFGIHYGRKRADEKKAVDNALQCFQDGMIAVFIDKERFEELEDAVPLREDSEVTLVRLTFLAGRM